MSKKTKVASVTEPQDKLDGTSLDRLTKNGFFTEAIGSVVQDNFANLFGERAIETIFAMLKAESERINEGDLKSIERMLIVQAHTLNAVFNSLAYRAGKQDSLHLLESLIRLSFKAQAQCRATLETLANIKNPPNAAFVKQANIGHNQQVNNAFPLTGGTTRAREIKNQQNQLLENSHDEQLVNRTESSSINADKELEAVGKVYRTTKSRG